MSAGGPSENDDGQDFELNLAPIIDCFTVLITYMLVSASFISLDMLEVQVATSAEVPADSMPTDPQTTLSVELAQSGEAKVQVSGKEEATYRVPAAFSGGTDIVALGEQVAQVRAKWDTIEDVSVRAEPGVQYKEIVRAVEGLKKTVPKVFLGE